MACVAVLRFRKKPASGLASHLLGTIRNETFVLCRLPLESRRRLMLSVSLLPAVALAMIGIWTEDVAQAQVNLFKEIDQILICIESKSDRGARSADCINRDFVPEPFDLDAFQCTACAAINALKMILKLKMTSQDMHRVIEPEQINNLFIIDDHLFWINGRAKKNASTGNAENHGQSSERSSAAS